MLALGLMRRALLVSLAVSIMIPFIGNVIVLRRLSNIGEALSHTSLAGVTIGLVFGFSPTAVSMIACVVASLIIEWMRQNYPQYAEISVNVVLSAGIGLAAIFSSYAGNSANFNAYLFGSVVAVSQKEVWLVWILCLGVVLFSLLLYRPLFSITFDEENALLRGLPIRAINLAFAVVTAVVVSLAAQTVGALIVTSLIVLPVAASMLLASSYRSCLLLSIVLAVFITMGGLILSYYAPIRPGLKPGGTMALLGVLMLLVVLLLRKKKRR